MRLTTELKAPIFKLQDVYDREIDLEAYSDKKIFIGFFRHAGCPFCNLRVHFLKKSSEEFKAMGLEMIFFFESDKKTMLRSTFHQEISPIPLISDPEKKWYDAYGLESSALISAKSHITTFVQTAFKARKLGLPMHMMAAGESINTIPAEFLIDKGLVVKKVHYSEGLNDRMDISLLKEFARS